MPSGILTHPKKIIGSKYRIRFVISTPLFLEYRETETLWQVKMWRHIWHPGAAGGRMPFWEFSSGDVLAISSEMGEPTAFDNALAEPLRHDKKDKCQSNDHICVF
jgi:hypothetical protein